MDPWEGITGETTECFPGTRILSDTPLPGLAQKRRSCYETISFIFLSARIFTTLRAGLALKIVS